MEYLYSKILILNLRKKSKNLVGKLLFLIEINDDGEDDAL